MEVVLQRLRLQNDPLAALSPGILVASRSFAQFCSPTGASLFIQVYRRLKDVRLLKAQVQRTGNCPNYVVCFLLLRFYFVFGFFLSSLFFSLFLIVCYLWEHLHESFVIVRTTRISMISHSVKAESDAHKCCRVGKKNTGSALLLKICTKTAAPYCFKKIITVRRSCLDACLFAQWIGPEFDVHIVIQNLF